MLQSKQLSAFPLGNDLRFLEGKSMPKLPLVTAATIALTLAVAPLTAARAVECNPGQGRAIELDFKVGSDGEPVLNLDPRAVSEVCVDGASTYRLRGMPGRSFTSSYEAFEVFHLVKKLKNLGFTDGGDFAKAAEFVVAKEKEVADKTAKPKQR